MSTAGNGASTDGPRKELSPEALARKIEKVRLSRLRLKEKKRAQREGDGSAAPQQKKAAPNESNIERSEKRSGDSQSRNGTQAIKTETIKTETMKTALGIKPAAAPGDRLLIVCD
jgi:hypothetical protein